MNEHIEVLRGLLNYPGLREYVGRIIYDKAVAAVDAMGEQREPAQQPSVEKFSGTFRCESNGIVGYKNAPIHSVTMHDDGVIEVVIDHWPQQPLTDERDALEAEIKRLRAETEAEVEAAARRLNEELRAVGVYLGIDTRIRMARVVLEYAKDKGTPVKEKARG